eukprot:gb/GECH01014566.1/.p1 GENE.gb/GECH01014566.1/~~gb/GECH01014566.1/.p1  ORF type:complete len:412 (+),score=110.81 gb/GECH01014566.1/:1-1236(+)
MFGRATISRSKNRITSFSGSLNYTRTNRLNTSHLLHKKHNIINTRNFSGSITARAQRDFGDILEEVLQSTKESKQQMKSEENATDEEEEQQDPDISNEEVSSFFKEGNRLKAKEFVDFLKKDLDDPSELTWLLHNGLRGTREQEEEEEKEFWDEARKQRIGEPERDYLDGRAKMKGVKTSHIVSDYMPEMREYFRSPSVEWEDVKAVYQQSPEFRNAIIVDLREDLQVASAEPIPGSINLPMSLIHDGGLLLEPPAFAQAFGVAKPPVNKDLILVSVDPNAAELAAIAFALSGWFRVFNYREGMNHFIENFNREAEEIFEKYKDPESEETSAMVQNSIEQMEREYGIRGYQEMKLKIAHQIVALYDAGDMEALKKLVTPSQDSPLSQMEITDNMIEKGVESARELIDQYAQ